MAPVPYPCQLQLMPYTSPHLLRNVWRRLYPHGDEPVYRVYRERLADSVYEYHAVVTLRTSSDSGSYTRTSRSGYASTASQAVQFAAFEVLVELRYTEVQMQHHPGFYYYPSLHDNGRVRFPLVNPESDSVASHLARYITASYLMIHELARELTRACTALAATLVTTRSTTTPSSLGFTPYVPVSSSSPISPVTPSSSTGVPAVNPLSTPAEWVSLLATPAAPMLHPTPAPEGEPSRQRRRVTFNPEVSVNHISSGSETASGEDTAAPAEQ